MTDVDFERLAWERLDGTISADDETLLDAMLVEDSLARRRFESLQKMARELSGVAQAPPPAELGPRINRAVAATSPRWRRPAVLVGPWGPRLAYLAAGLVAGAIAARLLLPGPALDDSLAAGTLIAARARPATAVEVDLAGKGALAMWRSGGHLNLDLAVRTHHRLEVSLEAAQGGLAIQRIELSGGSKAEAVADAGGVRVCATGPGRSTVVVSQRGEQSVIVVRATSNGVVLAEREVRADELGAGR